MATVEQCEKYKQMVGAPKPCPFCGCTDTLVYNSNCSLANPAYVACCDNIDCKASIGNFKYKQHALDAWNRRQK